MANTFPPGNTVVEIQINPAAHLQEGFDLSPEQVCEQYTKELIEILGPRQVTIDIPQLTVRAEFSGQAGYSPRYATGRTINEVQEVVNCLSISTQVGSSYGILFHTPGIGSVKINGVEKKEA